MIVVATMKTSHGHSSAFRLTTSYGLTAVKVGLLKVNARSQRRANSLRIHTKDVPSSTFGVLTKTYYERT